jgi:glycogen(starch) synthase
MRVLMLTWEYPPNITGGLGKHVYALSNALAAANVEVHIVTMGEPESAERNTVKDLHVYRAAAFNPQPRDLITNVLQTNLEMVERAIQVIDSLGDFDIIHAHDWLVAFAAKTLKHAYRLPLIATIHATEYGRNSGLHNELQRYISDIEWMLTFEAWKVVCCSRYMRGELQHVFQIPEDKLRIIPNGVEPLEFRSSVDVEKFKRNYAAWNERVVFFVGRHVREKGVGILIEAIPRVIGAYSNVKFIIAGRGPESENYKRRAAELGIADRIYFTGFIDDATRNGIYRIADLAVFPSLYEPFGIVALEGMAAGTPVVVSDVGGLGEVVNQDIGIKVPPGDVGMLAQRIIEALQDPKWRKTLSENAYTHVTEVYTWEKISKQTSDVYAEVLEESVGAVWEPRRIPTSMVEKMRSAIASGKLGRYEVEH